MRRDDGGKLRDKELDWLRGPPVGKREANLDQQLMGMKKPTKKRAPTDPAEPARRGPARGKRQDLAQPKRAADERVDEPGPARPWRALGFGVGLALAAVLAVSAFDLGSSEGDPGAREPTAAPPEPPAPPDAIALLDGLAVGDEEADFKVVSLSVPSNEQMARSVAVGLERRDGIGFTVWVTAAGTYPWRPPRSSAKYALFYSLPHPEGVSLDEDVINGVLDAIVARVARNEDRVARPSVL
jgi:hypothetical protein